MKVNLPGISPIGYKLWVRGIDGKYLVPGTAPIPVQIAMLLC
jgi:hypothetical protein